MLAPCAKGLLPRQDSGSPLFAHRYQLTNFPEMISISAILTQDKLVPKLIVHRNDEALERGAKPVFPSLGTQKMLRLAEDQVLA